MIAKTVIVLMEKRFVIMEQATFENLMSTYDDTDNWKDQDLRNMIICLQSSIKTLVNSCEGDNDRDQVVAGIGRCLRYLEGVAICHKSHFQEAVMLDRKLNC